MSSPNTVIAILRESGVETPVLLWVTAKRCTLPSEAAFQQAKGYLRIATEAAAIAAARSGRYQLEFPALTRKAEAFTIDLGE